MEDEEHGRFKSPPTLAPSESSYIVIVTLTLLAPTELSEGPRVVKPTSKSKTSKRIQNLPHTNIERIPGSQTPIEPTGPRTSPLSIPNETPQPSPSPRVPTKPARPSQNSRSTHTPKSPSPAPNKTPGSTSSTRKVSQAPNVQGATKKVGAGGKQITIRKTFSAYRPLSHRLPNATAKNSRQASVRDTRY